MSIYLDWAATSMPDPEIIRAGYEKSIDIFGNPSSRHLTGTAAKKLLEESRERCACALRTEGRNIFFTSGGTESNNIALLSLFRKKVKGTIISTNIEHPSVYEAVKLLGEEGFKIIRLDPDRSGIINPDEIREKLTADTMLVSVMHVNNETGAIQPVEKIGEIIREHSLKSGKKTLFHCDGVQAAGKIDINLSDSNIDFYTASSHKISGPKGCGLIYCRDNFHPLYSGGGQEGGIRPGTENTSSIYSFSLALEKYAGDMQENRNNALNLYSLLADGLSEIKDCSIIPDHRKKMPENFSPYICNFYIKKIPSEVLTRVLSDRGFFISAGSACSSLKKNESLTLKSMKIEKAAALSSVRVSTGPLTKPEDISAFCRALAEESEILLNVYR